MAKFEPTVLTVQDFKDLYDRGLLELSPKFQRRSVWKPQIKSYFLDTLFQGFPSPKIYVRERLSKKRMLIREVVDGQQRLRTILDYIHNEFKVATRYNARVGDLHFVAVPQDLQREFMKYRFSVDLMKDATDKEVIDMFMRLNTYTVSLRGQELRNAKYHGSFKTAMYNVASKNLSFLLDNSILSQTQFTRMADAELVSELVIAMLWGMQDKKKSINHYYSKYDKAFPQEAKAVERFEAIIQRIKETFGETLALSSFHKRALFYTLFCVMYDLEFGLPEEDGPYGRIRPRDFPRVREAMMTLTNQIESPSPAQEYVEFVTACQRQTDNLIPRRIRHQTVLRELRGPPGRT